MRSQWCIASTFSNRTCGVLGVASPQQRISWPRRILSAGKRDGNELSGRLSGKLMRLRWWRSSGGGRCQCLLVRVWCTHGWLSESVLALAVSIITYVHPKMCITFNLFVGGAKRAKCLARRRDHGPAGRVPEAALRYGAGTLLHPT